MLLRAFSSLRFFTHTWQFTLIPEQGRLARGTETGGKGCQIVHFQGYLVTCSSLLFLPPRGIFFLFLLYVCDSRLNCIFSIQLAMPISSVVYTETLFSWVGPWGADFGGGGKVFAWCFCKINHGVKVPRLMWNYGSRTFLSKDANGRRRKFLRQLL